MISDRKIQANRANAKHSRGPKTFQGRARSTKNALSHGLNLSIVSDLSVSKEDDELARQLSGSKASTEILAHARRIVEARLDLLRVRRVHHGLLSQLLSDPYFDTRANHLAKMKLLLAVLSEGSTIDTDLDKVVQSKLQGSQKLLVILMDKTRRLAALDRYERRALSRFKFAIRDFDEARGRQPPAPPPLA